ncbi:MAG: ornithine carbamoyltransferase [Alphaproteobacteria bacterium]|jgi:ornithine carbamoyltransferase|nr:ornithine carbamoyltransferase [Alphaproteobacteria bacterium]MBU0803566.1 ornithine carbamoyltransferase [Alphaproteobacteria bacterium]MBU0873137.1 ornithine carbamoyltransferase [Alphaproteobacteria bacterium]MBU1402494.1 ornithine carbamoyltransferase [Alphaproteobacteria bacterium]MBU1593135.1 ornithine carbamoyltransferase [Alphaproteobacteria bacterium]
MTGGIRHFTDLSAVSEGELRGMLTDASARKARLKAGERSRPLDGKVLAMIFDKPSTRTRVSFDVGMRQLGGETIMLTGTEMQLGRSETIADTAKVLSRYVDAIMIRTTAHERLLELTEHATVPVINGLTDDTHPCQLMADIMTFEEHRGPVAGKTISWIGDGNNVVHSLLEASARFSFNLRIAVPEGSEPEGKYVDWARANGGDVTIMRSPQDAADQADCIMTDCWVSMGQEHRARGHNVFLPYQVNADLMQKAKSDALFMHCLPAHRGEEVTDDVIDGPHSVVFDEAENRLHAQKAVLAWCLGA